MRLSPSPTCKWRFQSLYSLYGEAEYNGFQKHLSICKTLIWVSLYSTEPLLPVAHCIRPITDLYFHLHLKCPQYKVGD